MAPLGVTKTGNLIIYHTNPLHVLLYYIHKPSPWSSICTTLTDPFNLNVFIHFIMIMCQSWCLRLGRTWDYHNQVDWEPIHTQEALFFQRLVFSGFKVYDKVYLVLKKFFPHKGLVDFRVQQGNAVKCNISLQLLMHYFIQVSWPWKAMAVCSPWSRTWDLTVYSSTVLFAFN